MLTRKCDICGAEMRMTTPRYKVTFDGWLYKSEKDICVPCFERIKAEIQTADTPQTDCDKCIWNVCNYNEVEWDADTSQTESTGSPIGDYRDGVGAWQTDCNDRYAVRTDSGEVVAYACPLGCEQTDCGWGEPNE